MEREIFLIDDPVRLVEILAEQLGSEEAMEGALGVGFFAARPVPAGGAHEGAASGPGSHAPLPNAGFSGRGVELVVSPPFLLEPILAEIGRGRLSPFAVEPFLLGAEKGWAMTGPARAGAATLPKGLPSPRDFLKRWVMTGLQPLLFQSNHVSAMPAQVSLELADSMSVEEGVAVILRALFGRLLGLRASLVVVLLDTVLLVDFFRALSQWRLDREPARAFKAFLELPAGLQAELVLREIVGFTSEEALNPRIAFVCQTPEECRSLKASVRGLVAKSASCRDVTFRI